jgi:hypothetical protein
MLTILSISHCVFAGYQIYCHQIKPFCFLAINKTRTEQPSASSSCNEFFILVPIPPELPVFGCGYSGVEEAIFIGQYLYGIPYTLGSHLVDAD